jgi:hypothetical protein
VRLLAQAVKLAVKRLAFPIPRARTYTRRALHLKPSPAAASSRTQQLHVRMAAPLNPDGASVHLEYPTSFGPVSPDRTGPDQQAPAVHPCIHACSYIRGQCSRAGPFLALLVWLGHAWPLPLGSSSIVVVALGGWPAWFDAWFPRAPVPPCRGGASATHARELA